MTLRGNTHAQNVGASILASIGHPEFVASSSVEYLDIAVGLANDLGSLGEKRKRLREDMEKSSLLDHRGYMREVEDLFREMVRNYGGGVGGAVVR